MTFNQFYRERDGVITLTTIYDGGYRLDIENRGKLDPSIDVYSMSLSDYETVTAALYNYSGERLMPSELDGDNALEDFLGYLYEPGSDTGKEHTMGRKDLLLLHRELLRHTSKPIANAFGALVTRLKRVVKSAYRTVGSLAA
tara:strand:- start:568 stop:993 length:426 start_codon:yes stop_codon:yes gene_type:complete